MVRRSLRDTQNWAKLVRLRRPRLELKFLVRGLRRNYVSPSCAPLCTRRAGDSPPYRSRSASTAVSSKPPYRSRTQRGVFRLWRRVGIPTRRSHIGKRPLLAYRASDLRSSKIERDKDEQEDLRFYEPEVAGVLPRRFCRGRFGRLRTGVIRNRKGGLKTPFLPCRGIASPL